MTHSALVSAFILRGFVSPSTRTEHALGRFASPSIVCMFVSPIIGKNFEGFFFLHNYHILQYFTLLW